MSPSTQIFVNYSHGIANASHSTVFSKSESTTSDKIALTRKKQMQAKHSGCQQGERHSCRSHAGQKQHDIHVERTAGETKGCIKYVLCAVKLVVRKCRHISMAMVLQSQLCVCVCVSFSTACALRFVWTSASRSLGEKPGAMWCWQTCNAGNYRQERKCMGGPGVHHFSGSYQALDQMMLTSH